MARTHGYTLVHAARCRNVQSTSPPGLRARNRKSCGPISTSTSANPADSSLAGSVAGSTGVRVSNEWKRFQIIEGVLSEPANTPPGRRTRNTSEKSRSWAATEGTWCSIVKDTALLNVPSGKSIRVASPSITVTFDPSQRRRRSAARRRSISRQVRSGVRSRSSVVVSPGPGPSSSA